MDKAFLNKIKSDFEFLGDFGFRNSKNKWDSINSKFSWVLENIGIEIEIDLMDFSIFLLVVKVDDFKLPKGYYMYKGERVRAHLQLFLVKNKISFDKKQMKVIHSIYQRLRNNRSNQLLLELSNAYSVLLKGVLEKLAKDSNNYSFEV